MRDIGTEEVDRYVIEKLQRDDEMDYGVVTAISPKTVANHVTLLTTMLRSRARSAERQIISLMAMS